MENPNATVRRTLNDAWQLREAPKPGASPATSLPWMPAQVPGHVHLDLMRAGVIADPFYRMMERGVGWVDEADWTYSTTFTLDEVPPHACLVFEGLDTLAEITLNGEPLGTADNMFIAHEFPVDGRLNTGENTLTVSFASALRVGRERRAAWDASGEDSMQPDWFTWGARSFVRKAQYMYGWDWGPEPVSGGIWQGVALLSVPVARLLDWSHDTRFHDDGSATVDLTAWVERAPGHEQTPITFHLTAAWRYDETGTPEPTGIESPSAPVPEGAGRVPVTLSIHIEDPRRWRPNAHPAGGDGAFACLYDLRMLLLPTEPGGGPIDERTARIGLRTVELVHEPDPDGAGESFLFRVNGEDLFIKGANWIPADSFPGRLQNASTLDAPNEPHHRTVERLLTLARDAGYNMLRVWGGGLYESDHFYETCDRLGILVWQDFTYACAYYPDRGGYAEAARIEATAAVRRLRNHPALALWCGNNENAMMHFFRWSGDNTPARLLGEHIYHEVLPAVLQAEDPGRPYWPSSPYGGQNPNSPDFGDRHNWDVWHSAAEPGPYAGDWPGYADDASRFCSEFGFASSCGLAAWDTVLDESDKNPYSAAVRWHDKTRKGYDTYIGYITRHFPKPQTLSDLVYYSQCNQAEALKFGVEHYRRLKGRCWGTLFWQFNDCWPVQSWAVVDYIGQPKAAYFASKRFYAPLLLSFQTGGGAVEVHLTNDTMQPARGTVTVLLETFDGERLSEQSASCTIAANRTGRVLTLDLSALPGHERTAFAYARFVPEGAPDAAAENTLFFAEPKDLRLADPGLSVDVTDNRVTVSAERFAPYVWLRLIDIAGATPPLWSDNLFHLRPGESRTLTVTTDTPLSASDIRARLSLRTL